MWLFRRRERIRLAGERVSTARRDHVGMTTIGVLHPGEMGAAIAAGFRAGGADVVWVGDGRSAATRARAVTAGLRDANTLDALVAEVEIVVSVCPPDAAVSLAKSVADLGFAGIYVDANAVSPATARAVDECVSASGARYVDGGIIGGPDAPRLFLAGAAAAEVAAECGDPVESIVLDGGRYSASALKMVYAGWTKTTTALLLSLSAAARQLGVEEAATSRVGTFAAGARPAPRRRGGQHAQGVAVGRRDGGDRPNDGRCRPARWVPPRRRGGVRPARRAQGRRRGHPRRRPRAPRHLTVHPPCPAVMLGSHGSRPHRLLASRSRSPCRAVGSMS